MKSLLTFTGIIVLTALACGGVAAPASIPIASSPAPASNPENLWFLTRGEARSDQAWGVETDSQGNIYTAGYYQSPATAAFFDILIYKSSPEGKKLGQAN